MMTSSSSEPLQLVIPIKKPLSSYSLPVVLNAFLAFILFNRSQVFCTVDDLARRVQVITMTGSSGKSTREGKMIQFLTSFQSIMATIHSSLTHFHYHVQQSKMHQPLVVMFAFGSSISMPKEIWRVTLKHMASGQEGACWSDGDVKRMMRMLLDAYIQITLRDLGLTKCHIIIHAPRLQDTCPEGLVTMERYSIKKNVTVVDLCLWYGGADGQVESSRDDMGVDAGHEEDSDWLYYRIKNSISGITY
ncbi:hypothetical protein SeMB42_g01355 [Synchytrium endobioticum]|uniref:Uncharacterized protein n=1 Tax=Synchytrium endobioticum TaxID=286115 RepID=A0A507DCZ1_9FUNG|nr:hypothetical protein SeLEV6574_g01377 [Synchytrium endobioticum]TPX52524.1 hypothetical protein SeMB42_g01355 [Synchytrium endobioticum]